MESSCACRSHRRAAAITRPRGVAWRALRRLPPLNEREPGQAGLALRWVILLLAAVNLAAGHRELALERRAESGRPALVLAVAVAVVSVDHHVQLI